MKQRNRTILLAVMAFLAVSITFYRLENWVQHEASFLLDLLMLPWLLICAVMIVVHIVQGSRTKEWLWMILGVLFGVVCMWGINAYMYIPDCLECDHATADALGWMAPWFYPQ